MHIEGQNYHFKPDSILKCNLDEIYIEKDIQSRFFASSL